MKKTLPQKIRLLVLLILILPFLMAFSPQEKKVNQRKINREQRQKENKAEKQYNQAKKDHKKRQSKETQAMMKKSHRESKKNTPMKAPGGKKCK